MTTAYSRMEKTDDGARRLASARLRYRVLEVLHEALAAADTTKADLARRLGIRKSAVSQVFGGDGNVRVNTLAEYLHSLGFELELGAVPAGTARQQATGQCPPLRLAWNDSRPMAPIRDEGRSRPDVVGPRGEGLEYRVPAVDVG